MTQTVEVDGATDNTAPEIEQATTQEDKAPSDLTDAELEALLSGDSEEADVDQEPVQQEAEGEQLESEVAPSAQDKTEVPPEQPAPEKEALSQQELMARLEKQQKQLEQQELFIKRRSSELGDLRKQNRQLREQLSAQLNQKFDEDPKSATEDLLAIKELDRQDELLASEEQYMSRVAQTKEVFRRHVDPDEVSMDDMAASLELDGIPGDAIERFRADPYSIAEPGEMLQLAKRARAEKALRQVVAWAKQRDQQARELEAKLQQAKGRPQTVLQNVQRALKSSAAVNGSTGGTVESDDAFIQNPTKMTYAQLEEALKKARS